MALYTKQVKQETLTKLHGYVLKVLAEKGVKFYSEKAIELFKKHGAKVKDNVVFISEEMLKNALKTTPAKFEIKGRDEQYNVTVGGGKSVFCPAYGPVFVARNNERFEATTLDLINFSKLAQSSTVIHMMNPYVITPNDVEDNKLLLLQQAITLKYGSKPTMCVTAGYKISKEALKMVKKVNSKHPDDCVAIGLVNTLSPLAFDEAMCGAIFAFSEEKQAIIFGCGSLPGATSPVSIMGTLITATCEILAGIVLAQLISPGVPCVFGIVSASTDMRFVTPACGSAEAIKIIAMGKSLGEFYNVPCRGTGAVTDSKETDFEAGAESALVMAGCIVSGMDYIIHSCGILDSFNTIGYEKFVLDEQNIEIIKFMLEEPNEDETTIGLDAIFEVGHGEQFIEHMHTFNHMNTELYTPKISLRGYYEPWKNSGGATLLDVANKVIDKRLAEFDDNFDDTLTVDQRAFLDSYL